MNKKPLQKAQSFIFAVMIILLAILLIYLGAAKNIIKTHSRPDGDYAVIEDVSLQKTENPAAPTGIVNEYRFTLGEIEHADTLAFFINHNNIEVFLSEECVYRLTVSDGPVRTFGGSWVMIPLYGDDIGKEVRVVLTPIYSDYQNEAPDFLLGSELAIYKAYFYRAFPELLLSLSAVLAGLFLLCIAVYNSIKSNAEPRLYALSMLAVSAGLWRFTYGEFAYILFEAYTDVVYNISIASLMFVSLAMINSLEYTESKKGRKAIGCLTVVFCVIYIAQFLLQLAGVLDLREMLKFTHITIVASAGILCVSSVRDWLRYPRKSGKFINRNYSWILGVGAIVDLLLYYFSESSVGMLFILCAVLCYSMIEGIRLLIIYTHQKNTLEEKDIQLTLSRTTTMMSQIRSHFVFNLLNAISGMCKYDPEKADETVVRFARYLRNNIDIMEDDKPIPFTADLRQLEDYVILEQVRFGDKIEFITDIEVSEFMIPPLILQPVVENAIKHGITKKQDGGTILLRTWEEGDNIKIEVEDDGVGFDLKETEKEKSVGLKNIRFRLLYLMKGTLDISSKVGRGTTVTITIPKKEAEKCT